MSRAYRGISEPQANAEALARRDTPYTVASEISFQVKWDMHRREPEDLREAVFMARKAYSDEVPDKLHENALADDGTPRMTAKAQGYIFGGHTSSDGKAGEVEMVSYFHTPFRATLERMQHGVEAQRKRAAIVSHITIGSQPPGEAAMVEGVPSWAAKVVAEDALRTFLRGMSDMKVHARRSQEAAQAVG